MRILLIMDPGLPVPPILYGGHERLVYLFAEEYHRLGHQVSLLAGPGSSISGTIYSFGAIGINKSKWTKYKEIIACWSFLSRNHINYDLIHNFGRLIYLFPILNKRVNKIMTYGRSVTASRIKYINSLPNQNLIFTACSNFCTSTGNVSGIWKTIYNSIDFSKYEVKETVSSSAPLIFLGRLDKLKGPHLAIKAAKRTGDNLIIAGNMPTTTDNLLYFDEHVAPLIDGKQIKYVGPVNDIQKNELLGVSKALLFPISTEEAFGMVMIEAMACGTPVIAYNRAAVPEVISENLNGFIVNNFNEMCEAIEKIGTINRATCRQTAKKRFDKSVIAKEYLELF